MLILQTTGEGTTIFEATAHGIGAYFIGGDYSGLPAA
jgi:hypothetical protein